MDSKTVKLNCLTLGELENEPIFEKRGVLLEEEHLFEIETFCNIVFTFAFDQCNASFLKYLFSII